MSDDAPPPYPALAFRRIECVGASLNGGFGRAWRLEPADLAGSAGLSGSPAA
jgi:hypothetical protein